ncbi:thiol-activated cytolysin family protein [Streptosporangium sp. NPDC023963]|uniref:thiol-activated cytolysin family protein n=1 Tax=Streptosporangium sp. NPDC023963 TaxID=3155608 RepID=UPI0034377269
MSVPAENANLVKGESSPHVYLVEDGRRRLIPDDVTFAGLGRGGYDAVHILPDHRLEELEEGRPLPSLTEGTLYVSSDATSAFLMRAGTLREVPDEQTLAWLPRERVSVVEPSDLKLFRIDHGPALASITDTSQSVLEVDAYLRSLAPLPAEPAGTREISTRSRSTRVDDVDVLIKETTVEVVNLVDEFTETTPVPDALWAGAVVTGQSVRSGALAPVNLTRHPGTLTVTTDLKTASGRSRSSRLDAPSLPSCIDTLNALIGELNPKDAEAAVHHNVIQVSSLEEGMVNLGLNIKGAMFGVSAKASLTGRLKQSAALGLFTQTYYNVAFTPDGSPSRFFADDVSLDEIKLYAGPDNPPCYISTVSYGRAILVFAESTESFTKVKAALDAAWKGAVSGDLNLAAEHTHVLRRSSLRVVVVGGSTGNAGLVLADPAAKLTAFIQKEIRVTADIPAAPVKYATRYLAPPHNLAAVNRTTQVVRVVDADVHGGPEVRMENIQVGEGRDSGPVNTRIRLARGDRIVITAEGAVWAGWAFIGRNGPEGLDGPGKPWYPLPQERGASLIAGYNNASWFYVGSGTPQPVVVPDEQHGSELWLRLNDDNMQNGDGSFKVTVTVRRRLPSIPAQHL